MKVLLAAVLLLAGCSADGAPQVPDDRVAATLGGVDLILEVADSPQERAVGLMGRASVPAGTGMVFRYDTLVGERFYMFGVTVALTAVFVRAGQVVSSVLMPPCPQTEPQDCPTYGADASYDTVVETAPETLPDVAPGDTLTVSRLSR